MNCSYTDSPNDISTHIHDCYELYYFISGDLTYYIEGQTYQLQPNDIIITNRRELHRIVFHSKKPYERKFIHFKPEYISFLQSDDYNIFYFLEKRKLGYFNLISANEVLSSEIGNLWDKIERTASEDSSESPLLIKALFIQMLIEINKVLSKNKNIVNHPVQNNDKVIAILDYINNNIEKTISLDLLENLFFVNKYYLCHFFKKSTGFTVNEYITYKRIMKAQELLNNELSVLEVSGAVGFGDYSNFYKAFRKIVGCSPKKYVKSKL